MAGHPDVVVTSARGIHGPQMSEMALLHMLSLARHVRTLAKQQSERRWESIPQELLAGRSVGIVGLGTSGRRLAVVCGALGMTVVGINRSQRPVPAVDRLYALEDLQTMAGEVDYLVLLLPGGDETRGLVDKSVLDAMRSTAFVVNLARGSVVVEPDLVAALENGRIAGAGLDVAAIEPLDRESPLWRLDNVFITPHLAGTHSQYGRILREEIVEPNLRAFFGGFPLASLPNIVSPAPSRSRPTRLLPSRVPDLAP